MFEITYHSEVAQKDLPKISADVKRALQKAIEYKLVQNPIEFGEPLRRTLKGFWKLRVGDYRIIYKISGKPVLILRIGHRREIYQRWKTD